ncbi:acylphosphatase [Oerskovia merdavium]|uniref:acylphosphatase n=1 Tax=Oerskovia merdavium TaxID=2762227 RepID=A0ABR8TYH0_9CELL|nr:acylphosphatase [Oerskovia merdavium]MBD7980795.1 acylphosphatase [Oerskovia merdavium]
MAGGEVPSVSAARAVVHGHVQGVGFRYATTRRAAELGLVCEAQNLPDGTVLVTVRGAAADVEVLVDWLRGGRTPGRVTGVDVQPM